VYRDLVAFGNYSASQLRMRGDRGSDDEGRSRGPAAPATVQDFGVQTGSGPSSNVSAIVRAFGETTVVCRNRRR